MPATIPIDEAQAKLRELIHQLAPWEYPNRHARTRLSIRTV